MTNVTRVGDIGQGTCNVHRDPTAYTTVHVTGASTVYTNNVPQAIIGTQGATSCGHTTPAVSGSSTVFAESSPIHRIGDIGVINEGSGEHLVISGSPDVDNDS